MKIIDIFSSKILNYFWKLLPASKPGFQKSLLCICQTVTKYSNISCQARKKDKPSLYREVKKLITESEFKYKSTLWRQ